MGQCYGKEDDSVGGDSRYKQQQQDELVAPRSPKAGSNHGSKQRGSFNSNHSNGGGAGGASPLRHKTSFSSHPSPRHPAASPLPHYASSPAPSTPRRLFKRPFPPPSPAKHIQSSLVKRHGTKPTKEGGLIPDAVDNEKPLDKHFAYAKNFTTKYELGHEVGRGHFGHTCYAKVRRGELKGHPVAVKIISKAKVHIMIMEFLMSFACLSFPPLVSWNITSAP